MRKLIFSLVILVAQFTIAYEPCKVIRVIDGDTFIGLVDNEEIRIRLADIDAPEKKQEYGKESTMVLTEMLSNEPIMVDVKGTDLYGRTIAFIYADGKNVGLQMVKEGAAWPYKRNRDEAYWRAMNYAKQDKKGLWNNDNPVNPSDFRKYH